MMQNILPACAAFVIFAALFWGSVILLPKLPAKWFCDYDEKPNPDDIRQKLHNKKSVNAILSILTGFSAAACVFTRGLNVQVGFICLAFVLLLLIAVSDVKFTIIPDEFVLGIFILSLPVYILNGLEQKNRQGWVFPWLGAAVGCVFVLTLNAVGKLIYKADVFGMGDTKLLCACGFLCSLKLTAAVIFLSIVAAGVHFSALALAKKAQKPEQRPFGPYITAATLAALSLTPVLQGIWEWYIGLISH